MHLERLLSILEAIAIAGRPLSATEIQTITSLPLPTCYRLLQMMKAQHLLTDPDSNNRYIIGDRLIRIALLSRTDPDVAELTAPVLKAATRDFGEAVFLSRFREKGVSIIHVETPADPSISYIHPGLGFRPMHACSCAKAIAAFADEKFQSIILNGRMKAYTEHTLTDPEALAVELSGIRKSGYAECVEEIEVGVSSVAAPVTIENLGAVFSVGTIGPIRRFNNKHRRALGKKLITLAQQISLTINTNAPVQIVNAGA